MRENRLPFDPNGPFVCVKPFLMSGVPYAPGATVPMQGVEPRRVRQMWQARMVNVASASQIGLMSRQPAHVKPEPRAAAPAAQKPAPAAQEQPAPASGLRATHKGFGRWFVVDAEGKIVAGPMTQVEATSKLGELSRAAA